MYTTNVKKIIGILFGFVALIAAIALVRDTAAQGQDFVVFWRAARQVLHGQPAYDLVRDGAMIYKYPPWVLPVVFPFALLPLELAKVAWGFLQILSLAAAIIWLVTNGVRSTVVFFVAIVYWGIWAVHALDGQIMLLFLALLLWFGTKKTWLSALLTIWAATAKIFTAVALVGAGSWRLKRGRFILVFSALLLLSAPVWFAESDRNPASVVASWVKAAGSGGVLFAGQKVRGRDNQGFPALVLRTFDVPAENTRADFMAFFFIVATLGFFWWKYSRSLREGERWAGWLALACVAHPLAWFHQFVLTFPLAALSVEKALNSRKRSLVLLSLFGVVFIGAVTRKTFGLKLGQPIELLSIKSIGTVICALALIKAHRSG